MELIHFNICNINTEIKLCCNNGFARILKNRYQNFLNPSCTKPIDLALSLNTFPAEELLDNTLAISADRTGWLIKGTGFRCRISKQVNHLSGSGICRETIYAFDSLLRMVWTQLLLCRNGFLVHACGVSNGVGAYLFPGPSGSGKTTLARKATRQNVLSDELVGLQVKDGRCFLMGTPFWGEFREGGLPKTKDLSGIYFLKPSNRLKITPMTLQKAVKKLLKLVLFFNEDANSIERLLNLTTQCVLTTPCYQVCLAKNSGYNKIMKILNGRKGNAS